MLGLQLRLETRLIDAVIEGGLVVSTAGIKPGSIAIRDGKVAGIVAPGEKIAARERIDVSGCMILPGLVDAHVHFRDPGLTHKEDFGSGTRAAAVGGVTTVMVMPTDKPMTMTAELFTEKRAIGEASAHVDFALQAGLGPDTSHVRALCDVGAISFEVFLADLPPPMLVATGEELLRCLKAVADADRVAGITPGDDSIVAAHSNANATGRDESRRAFLASRPSVAEALGIARACVAASAAKARIHIRQVSAASSVDVLRALKSGTVSAEVTPHNLLLEADETLRRGPVAKVVPPLRSLADLASVQAALRDGVIDLVATDHAPHLPEEKALGEEDLAKAPGGFPGVQTLLPLMLRLVEQEVIDYRRLIVACCEAPARAFGLFPRKGTLQPGSDADLVVIDPGKPFVIRDQDQLSRARLTPFDGWRAPASQVLTMLRGTVVARGLQLTSARVGRFVCP
jgi:dihydroorotase